MLRRLTAAAIALTLLTLPVFAGAAKKIKKGTIAITFGTSPVTMDPHTSSSAILTTILRFTFDTLMHRARGKAVPAGGSTARCLVDRPVITNRIRLG